MDVSLGIDIGSVNLSITMINYAKNNQWFISDTRIINTGIKRIWNTKSIAITMKKVLDDYINEFANKINIKVVIIESQPPKRRDMNRILTSIVCYFTMLFNGIIVKTIRSPEKFKISGIRCPSGRKNYNLRKSMSITLGQNSLLDKNNIYYDHNTLWCTYINKIFPKRDDIYDGLLLVLHYHGYKYNL
jgi:hypothetical protein